MECNFGGSAPLPDSLSLLVNLQNLYVGAGNAMPGTFPTGIGALTSLQYVRVVSLLPRCLGRSVVVGGVTRPRARERLSLATPIR